MSGDRNESFMNPTATSSSMGGAVRLALELGHPYPGPGGPAQGSPQHGTTCGADGLGRGCSTHFRGGMRGGLVGGLEPHEPLSAMAGGRSMSEQRAVGRLRLRCESGDEERWQWVQAQRDAGADVTVGTGKARAAVRQFAAHTGRGAGASEIDAAKRSSCEIRAFRQPCIQTAARYDDGATIAAHTNGTRVEAGQSSVNTRRGAPATDSDAGHQCGRTAHELPPHFSTAAAALRHTGRGGEAARTGEACAVMGQLAVNAGRYVDTAGADAASQCRTVARTLIKMSLPKNKCGAADRTLQQQRVLLSAGSDNKDDPGFLISGFYSRLRRVRTILLSRRSIPTLGTTTYKSTYRYPGSRECIRGWSDEEWPCSWHSEVTRACILARRHR